MGIYETHPPVYPEDTEQMRRHKEYGGGPLYFEDLFEVVTVSAPGCDSEIEVLKTRKILQLEDSEYGGFSQEEEIIFAGTFEACEKLGINMTEFINAIVHGTKEMVSRGEWWR